MLHQAQNLQSWIQLLLLPHLQMQQEQELLQMEHK